MVCVQDSQAFEDNVEITKSLGDCLALRLGFFACGRRTTAAACRTISTFGVCIPAAFDTAPKQILHPSSFVTRHSPPPATSAVSGTILAKTSRCLANPLRFQESAHPRRKFDQASWHSLDQRVRDREFVLVQDSLEVRTIHNQNSFLLESRLTVSCSAI